MLTLYGYRYSLYTWIVRATLFECGLQAEYVETDPFAGGGFSAQPFGKVPLIEHDDFRLYETGAIARYLARLGSNVSLVPEETRQAARADQIIGIVDSYAYWPLVRQVASHGFFRPAMGLESDDSELALGLAAAPRILAALDRLVGDQGVLMTGDLSLADLYLGPVIAYFTMVPEGEKLLLEYPRLSRWWDAVRERRALDLTRPTSPNGT